LGAWVSVAVSATLGPGGCRGRHIPGQPARPEEAESKSDAPVLADHPATFDRAHPVTAAWVVPVVVSASGKLPMN